MGDVSASQVSPIVAHVAAASTQDGSGVESVTARHYGYPLVEQTRVDEGSAGLADGWDRVEVGFGRTETLVDELASYGPDVLVEAPDELRAGVLDRLRAAAGAA